MCIRPLPSSYSPLPSPTSPLAADETHFTSFFATVLRVISAVVGVVALISYAATKNDTALLTLGIAAACYVFSWLMDPPEEVPNTQQTPFRTQQVVAARISPPQTPGNSDALAARTPRAVSIDVSVVPPPASAQLPTQLSEPLLTNRQLNAAALSLSPPNWPRDSLPVQVVPLELGPRAETASSSHDQTTMPPPAARPASSRKKRAASPAVGTTPTRRTKSRAGTPVPQINKMATI